MRGVAALLALVATCGTVVAAVDLGYIEDAREPGNWGGGIEATVEGHSAFAALDLVRDVEAESRYAAAVAVLVRERGFQNAPAPLQAPFAMGAAIGPPPTPSPCDLVPKLSYRFPGVTWFNDQYLVEPSADLFYLKECDRHPCTGAVFVVASGDTQPLDLVQNTLNDTVEYIESYRIPLDPNGRDWIIDRLARNVSGTLHNVWAVPILNRFYSADGSVRTPQANVNGAIEEAEEAVRDAAPRAGTYASPYTTPDDGESHCPAIEDQQCRILCDEATNSSTYPCPGCPSLYYNAVVLVDLKVLAEQLEALGGGPSGVKDHRTNGTDIAACQNGSEWPCPGGDENAEGNSHPYRSANGTQYANHGGSADCSGDLVNDSACHVTYEVDVYYGHMRPGVVPVDRNFNLFFSGVPTRERNCVVGNSPVANLFNQACFATRSFADLSGGVYS